MGIILLLIIGYFIWKWWINYTADSAAKLIQAIIEENRRD